MRLTGTRYRTSLRSRSQAAANPPDGSSVSIADMNGTMNTVYEYGYLSLSTERIDKWPQTFCKYASRHSYPGSGCLGSIVFTILSGAVIGCGRFISQF